MRLITALTALFALPCFAGYVQPNVKICGVTSPYLRYDLMAPALTGSSSLGHKNQFFYISDVLNVTARLDRPGLSQASAINDFRTVLQIEGIRLCIVGDLYAAESKYETGKTIFTVYPNTFEIKGDAPLVMPSQLPGTYALKNSRTRYELVATRDLEHGERFRLTKFFDFLNRQNRQKNAAPCYQLSGPDLAIAVQRTSRTTLAGEIEVQCNPSDNSDQLKLTFTFSPRRLVIESRRSTKIQQYSLSLQAL